MEVEAVCFASGCSISICLFLTIIYLIKGIRYKKSKYFRGKVIYSRGTKIVVVNRRRGEIYETYNVSYEYKGKTLEGEVCTSEKGLEPGDDIFIYIYDPEGVHEIQSDINWRKFKFSAGFSLLMTVVFLISLYDQVLKLLLTENSPLRMFWVKIMKRSKNKLMNI